MQAMEPLLVYAKSPTLWLLVSCTLTQGPLHIIHHNSTNRKVATKSPVVLLGPKQKRTWHLGVEKQRGVATVLFLLVSLETNLRQVDSKKQTTQGGRFVLLKNWETDTSWVLVPAGCPCTGRFGKMVSSPTSTGSMGYSEPRIPSKALI